jgi:hypothetical protein
MKLDFRIAYCSAIYYGFIGGVIAQDRGFAAISPRCRG